MSRLSFRVRRYTVVTDRLPAGSSFRVALLSDLHGRDCPGLAGALRKEAPDVIAVAGDWLERYLPPGETDDYHEILDEWSTPRERRFLRFLKRADARVVGRRRRRASDGRTDAAALSLLSEAAAVAPTVYAPGNHERNLTEGDLAAIRQTGAVYLSDGAAALELPCGRVRFGGCAIRYGEDFLRAFAADPGVRVLLCHCPEYYDRLPDVRACDLVLAGHAHGGQIRLFGRGVYAPGQGFFPEYDGGVFHGNLVVGRGLANTAALPRLFNPREVAVVTVRGR